MFQLFGLLAPKDIKYRDKPVLVTTSIKQ
jgi:hypothetical protein